MKTKLIRMEVINTPPKHQLYKRDKSADPHTYNGLFHVNIVNLVDGKEVHYRADLSPEEYFLCKFKIELLAKGISEEDLDKFSDLVRDAERESRQYDNESCDCVCHL